MQSLKHFSLMLVLFFSLSTRVGATASEPHLPAAGVGFVVSMAIAALAYFAIDRIAGPNRAPAIRMGAALLAFAKAAEGMVNFVLENLFPFTDDIASFAHKKKREYLFDSSTNVWANRMSRLAQDSRQTLAAGEQRARDLSDAMMAIVIDGVRVAHENYISGDITRAAIEFELMIFRLNESYFDLKAVWHNQIAAIVGRLWVDSDGKKLGADERMIDATVARAQRLGVTVSVITKDVLIKWFK